MIFVEFEKRSGHFESVRVYGHACYSEYGKDIVCAAVSSALQMLINGLREILKVSCSVKQSGNEVFLKLHQQSDSAQFDACQAFMKSFCLHLEILSKNYPKTISVVIGRGRKNL